MAKRQCLIDRLSAELSEMTREHRLARILCGEVLVNGSVIRDPKEQVSASDRIAIGGARFVSRGGEKLDAALEAWGVAVSGKVFVDVGSSTGGFADCLLQRGALVVHAVDVGYNQLAYTLRTDSRVRVHEKTNIRDVSNLEPAPNAAVADLSFRSLRGVASRILDLTTEGWAILLIKPQFEWDAPDRGFHGVVPAAELGSILVDVVTSLAQEGAVATRLMRSPLPGRKGNQEFFVTVDRHATIENNDISELVSRVV